VFVRLTGCNLRCTWCDSAFTFSGGMLRRVEDVVSEVQGYGIQTVEVTGGEPLLQPNALMLLQQFVDLGFEVLLETSGNQSIAHVPPGVHIIMDLKPPDSGEVAANLWENIGLLEAKDEVKLVIASRRDYEWSREITRQHRLAEHCPVLFSPAWGLVDLADLAAWILEDKLPVRLNLQLHKVVWGAQTTGV
jgi:7-carboxy-7-deazaguanine synthase